MRRFPNFDREEIRAMFDLEDCERPAFGKKRVKKGWRRGVGCEAKTGPKWLAKGMTAKEIAELLEISTREVRRLAKKQSQ